MIEIFGFIILTGVLISTIYFLSKFRLYKITVNYSSYIAFLEFHMKKAYDMIYKDSILIYSIEAIKIKDEDFNILSKKFTLLVFQLIGPRLKDEFIYIYGNEETLIFNLIEYFNNRFESDEIRKKATDNLMNDDGKPFGDII